MPSLAECGYNLESSFKAPHEKGIYVINVHTDGKITALTEIDDTGIAPRPLTLEETRRAHELVEKFRSGEKITGVDFFSTKGPDECQETLTQICDVLASTAKQDLGKSNATLRPVFTQSLYF